MRRLTIVFPALLVAALSCPQAARADVIQCLGSQNPACEQIGSFTFSFDDVFGTIFMVNNISGLTAIGGGDFTFTSDSLTVESLSGTSATFPLSVSSLSPAGTAETLDVIGEFTAATLTFSFMSQPFSAKLSSEIAETPIYAEMVVPEPSSMLLLGTGLAFGWARTRARRGRSR